MVWAGGVGTRGMGKRGRAEDKGKKQRDDLIGIIKGIAVVTPSSLFVFGFSIFIAPEPSYVSVFRESEVLAGFHPRRPFARFQVESRHCMFLVVRHLFGS